MNTPIVGSGRAFSYFNCDSFKSRMAKTFQSCVVYPHGHALAFTAKWDLAKFISDSPRIFCLNPEKERYSLYWKLLEYLTDSPKDYCNFAGNKNKNEYLIKVYVKFCKSVSDFVSKRMCTRGKIEFEEAMDFLDGEIRALEQDALIVR